MATKLKSRDCEMAICAAPELQDLVAVRLKVGGEHLEEYLSYHNAVTVIVRGLVVNNPDILACLGHADNDFFIIMNESRWKEPQWREGVNSINLEIMEEIRTVSGELFANSVWYTIMCRVAPEWNRVGNLFVQGCDFLTRTNHRKYRALEMKVAYLPPGRLQLILTPFTVSLSQLNGNDFGEDTLIQDVIQGKRESMSFSKGRQYSQPCYVLPRETRCMIVSLTKKLPTQSVFENYSELRNYWKDMYGYSLPKGEPDFYCEVAFYGMPRTMFTYPNYCLSPKKTELVGTNETDRAQCVKAFVTDLYAKVPVLCGVSVKLIHLSSSVASK